MSSVAHPDAAVATAVGRSGTAARRLKLWAIATPGLVVIALGYVPLVGLVMLSFSDRPMSGLPYPLTLQWYEHLSIDRRWMAPVGTSLLLSLIVGLAAMVLATFVGRAIPRLRRRGGVLAAFLLPLFVPGVPMGVAMFLYYRSFLDIKLGLWSLFLGQFVWAFPFSLLAVLIVSTRFDMRLILAAADLGASPWQRFWQIELPILRPGIAGAGIFGFLLSFNELPRSIYLRGVSTTLPLFEWAQASSQTSNIPYLFALSSVVLAVSLPLITAVTWALLRRAEG